MDWARGEIIGHGSFATVSLAAPTTLNGDLPPVFAVKSCGASLSSSLVNEKLILEELQGCPEIIHCYGERFSRENGEELYNLLLEYAPGGSLADSVRNSGDQRMPECEVRRYTRSILKGLRYIHKSGYVHRDLKLQNILLSRNGEVKIADFGLAGKAVDGGSGCRLVGTPLYMSPEMVASGEQGPASDVWALGCAVVEMVSGSPAWRGSHFPGLLMRIGSGCESPEIPVNHLSEEGIDFLERCFVRDPSKRSTAEMLLDHPFICGGDCAEWNVFAAEARDREEKPAATSSPRCPFDISEKWMSLISCSITSLPRVEYSVESWLSAEERLRGLVSGQLPDWSTDCWVTVRSMKRENCHKSNFN